MKIEVAPLRYGVVFKKAFCDPEIFKAFVKDILGLDLEIDKVETEKEFHPAIGYIRPRFDLFAQDMKNRIVVDIQHERDPDHYDRFLYYHCVAMLEQIATHELYRPRLQVFTIVILTSGDKHKRDVVTIEFDPKDRNGKSLGEIKHRIIYLCPKYADETTPASYREWLTAINDSLDGEVEENAYQRPEIHKIFDYIKKDLVSPTERYYMSEEHRQQQRFLAGLDEGQVLGREEGREVGRAMGREEGREETQRGIARGMLAKGLEIQLIAELTGLSQAEIGALR